MEAAAAEDEEEECDARWNVDEKKNNHKVCRHTSSSSPRP